MHALARFNELVSGYWLEQERAFVVRRPKVLGRDAVGRLHSATGKCMQYPDGWGFYAWHGVCVPEQVILTPETLTSEDFAGNRLELLIRDSQFAHFLSAENFMHAKPRRRLPKTPGTKD